MCGVCLQTKQHVSERWLSIRHEPVRLCVCANKMNFLLKSLLKVVIACFLFCHKRVLSVDDVSRWPTVQHLPRQHQTSFDIFENTLSYVTNEWNAELTHVQEFINRILREKRSRVTRSTRPGTVTQKAPICSFILKPIRYPLCNGPVTFVGVFAVLPTDRTQELESHILC